MYREYVSNRISSSMEEVAEGEIGSKWRKFVRVRGQIGR